MTIAVKAASHFGMAYVAAAAEACSRLVGVCRDLRFLPLFLSFLFGASLGACVIAGSPSFPVWCVPGRLCRSWEHLCLSLSLSLSLLSLSLFSLFSLFFCSRFFCSCQVNGATTPSGKSGPLQGPRIIRLAALPQTLALVWRTLYPSSASAV